MEYMAIEIEKDQKRLFGPWSEILQPYNPISLPFRNKKRGTIQTKMRAPVFLLVIVHLHTLYTPYPRYPKGKGHPPRLPILQDYLVGFSRLLPSFFFPSSIYFVHCGSIKYGCLYLDGQDQAWEG